MSLTSNQIIIIWEDADVQLRRHELRFQGKRLPSIEENKIKDAYLLWYLATYDSLLSDGFTPQSLDIRWLHVVCSIDVHELGSALKAADSFLLRNSAGSYEDFKHLLSADYPFIGRLLSPMKQTIVQWFEEHSIPHFSSFHSWLSFIGRVNLKLDVLENQALEEYLEIEKELSDSFTTDEALVLRSWLPRSEGYSFARGIKPRHGNGSTADAGRQMLDKYLAFCKDDRLRYLGTEFDPPRVLPTPLLRKCRLVFVPKSLLGYRSISMEPCSLMWYQQGILRSFVDYLHHHKYLRRRFVPEHQEFNRALAMLGSFDGSFATIDLSAASDSVTWAMARTWFRDTFLYKWLLCTRSTSVQLPDGTEMALKKFAPMGSALCFPIECLVFCAITECAIRECGGRPDRSLYRVYGDDIVVEAAYADAVIARLNANGFKVNMKKTFTASSAEFTFRESCGGEYLNGADVTPTRLSRRFSGLSVNVRRPAQIEALIELANDCNSRYPSVRRRVISSLVSLPTNVRPLFNGTGEGGIFSTSPTNWHLSPPRWSSDYQRLYLKHGSTHAKRKGRCDLRVEDIRLFEYLRQVEGRERLLYPEDRVDVDLRPQIAGIWAITSSPADGIIPSMEIKTL